MDSGADDAMAVDQIRFRPSTKRKAYRRRAEEREGEDDDDNAIQQRQTLATTADDDAPGPSACGPEHTREDLGDEDDGGTGSGSDTAVLAALRSRNTRKGRLRGVGFRSGGHNADRTAGSLVLANQEDEDGDAVNPLASIAGRFTHQTGVLNDVDDRHMNDYIESRLSSRAAQLAHYTQHDEEANASKGGQGPAKNGPERPIIQGKIVEVELHDDHRQDPRRDRGPNESPRKQRLGPDGKPWRGRNRRGSDDVKRDQLVEQFLSENRLDIYDVPKQPTATASEPDGAADRRLADEFRQQYMDDMARRRQLRKKKPVQPPKPRSENVLKGPKLGGSRNSRAAVRNALLEQKKNAK